MAMGTGWIGTDDGANDLVRFLHPAQLINRLLALGRCQFVGLGQPHVEVFESLGGSSEIPLSYL